MTTRDSKNNHGFTGTWIAAADLPACTAPGKAQPGKADLKDLLARAEAQSERARAPDKPCQQQLAISFFFDGTGNNKDLDAPKNKTSNIARLFDAHIDKPLLNLVPIYIPGVGTAFPEIGDAGGKLGDGMAKGGEGRLDYAMKRFDMLVRDAEALANNPANKITGIHIAIFGFSRGATKARAFAVRLHKRLKANGSGWVLKDKGYPVRIYFMGLLDTVASVGISNTIRNQEKRRVLKDASRGVPLVGPLLGPALVDAVLDNSEALKGHNSWAGELRIPPSVAQCLHYTAAHEVRESFPLDTVRVAASAKAPLPSNYPGTCTEVVYPGMHSNVGGGYAPGEHGRSAAPDAQLSQVPLLHMYQAALDAGVPLYQFKKLPEKTRILFKLSPILGDLFNYYTGKVGAIGCVEQQNAAHLYFYYCWRKLRATTEGDPYLTNMEQQRQAALARQKKHEQNILSARPALIPKPPLGNGSSRAPVTAFELRAYGAQAEQERKQRQSALDEEYKQRNACRNEAETAGKISRQIQEEDQRFIDDCKALAQRASAGETLSLYEKTLLKAWQGPLLADKKIIEFFDFHVHDSVAGFRSTGAGYVDNSRIARPRDVYQGRQPWKSA